MRDVMGDQALSESCVMRTQVGAISSHKSRFVSSSWDKRGKGDTFTKENVLPVL